MHDIGYYAGFLSTQKKNRINSAPTHLLLECLEELAIDLANDSRFQSLDENRAPLLDDKAITQLSALKKIALIRGLCDRIEPKLIEAAK